MTYAPHRDFPRAPLLYDVAQLDDPGARRERLHPLRGSRVVFANYPLLQHDFPHLRPEQVVAALPELAELSATARERAIHGAIDRWLLDNAAIMSSAQVAQSKVNTPISADPEDVEVVRPTRYGRAAVRAPTGSVAAGATGATASALLDIKGCGVEPGITPECRDHSNGLVYLGSAISSVIHEWTLHAAFRHAREPIEVIPTYALIDTGFDVRRHNGDLLPAGIQVRRAHRRPHGAEEIPKPGSNEELVKIRIELLLRAYGFTSAYPSPMLVVDDTGPTPAVTYGGHALDEHDDAELARIVELTGARGRRQGFDVINVQLTREVSADPLRVCLVDFEHYRFRSRFTYPIVNLVQGRLLRWGGALWPDERHFIQPDPRLCPLEQTWGWCPEGGRTRTELLGLKTAEELRSGAISRADAEARMFAQLGSVQDAWRAP